MNLTRNEKTVLKFLFKDSRMSDAAIAREMSISLQAVRNIRKKLETNGVIRGYITNLNYEKLGLNIYALAFFKCTSDAWAEFNEEKISKWLNSPNVIQTYRIPNGEMTHIVKYGFKDINQMNFFFKNLQCKYSKYVEIVNVFPLSIENITDAPQALGNSVLNDSIDYFKMNEIR